MFKYKVIIECIEDLNDLLDEIVVPNKVTFEIDGDCTSDVVLEHFIELMEVMGWNMSYYKQCFEDYMQLVEEIKDKRLKGD